MQTITKNEEEIYDRQIRLWGVRSQTRISASHCLIWGCTSSNMETAKNLLLAGVKITLCDDRSSSEIHQSYNYFIKSTNCLSIAEASVDSLQELNTLVPVRTVQQDDLNDLAFISSFNVIVIGGEVMKPSEAEKINEMCRTSNVLFFYTLSAGFSGFFCFDFGNEFTVEDLKVSILEKRDSVCIHDEQHISKTFTFPPFSALRHPQATGGKRSHVLVERIFLPFLRKDVDLSSFHMSVNEETGILETQRLSEYSIPESSNEDENECLNRSAEMLGVQFVPLGAIMGGLVSQEVIKGITHERAPHGNSICVSLWESNAVVATIGSLQTEKEKQTNLFFVNSENIEDLD
eukprot:GDKJ01045062.1.p1 GENE.GDKJ01045062.1~~GDKJ01045062.1.p1  ORF type:complete len:347 (+),score=73.65 GDKJ01045062.1:88-1128(+)